MNNLILKIKQESWAMLFFGFASILILWQILLPGYVLTLDMIFTPEYRIFIELGTFSNQLPIQFIIWLVSLILPVWLIQKFILLGLFFAMGFLTYKYLPVPSGYGANYWAGLFYMANPFVYQRLLAGQWMILFSYALLPVIIYLLNQFFHNPRLKNTLWLVTGYLVMGVFSLHFLVISLISGLIYLLFSINKDSYRLVLKQSLLGLILVFILSGYYLIPYISQSNKSNLSFFNQLDIEAFATAGDPVLGTTVNVLTMYGFWGESQPWSSYFIWPKDNLIIWGLLGVLLFSLIIYGAFKAIRQSKKQSLIFIALAVVGFIFSVGIGQTIFKPFNQFFFDHIWFWSGFRDTQKWSALLILAYTFFGAYGANEIFKKLGAKIGDGYKESIKFKLLVTVIFLIPVFYTYTIWGGLARQLKPVWYPNAWHQVKDILDQDQSDYRVLFMPFHQYLSLGFNQQIISQNPAKEFFGAKIIQGDKAEIGGVASQQINTPSAQISWILENYAKGGIIEQERLLKALSSLNIKYIIYLGGYENVADPLEFSFIESKKLKKILENKDLTFYEVLL